MLPNNNLVAYLFPNTNMINDVIAFYIHNYTHNSSLLLARLCVKSYVRRDQSPSFVACGVGYVFT